MPANNSYSFGDVYLVRFHPAVGSELKRYRPAVIVSDKVNSIDSRFTLIAPLSANLKNLNVEYELAVNDAEFLEKTSVILPWYLKTIDVIRLEKRLGSISESDKAKLKGKIAKVFVL